MPGGRLGIPGPPDPPERIHDQLANEPDKFLRIEGLGKKSVDPDIEPTIDLVLAAGADDDERKVTRTRIGTQPAGGPQPVEPRHHDIKGDKVGPHLMNDFQTLGTIGRGHDLDALQLEVDPDQLPDDLVVVHNKNPARSAWHNSRVGRARPPRPAFDHFHPARATPRPPPPRKRFLTTPSELVVFYPSPRSPRPTRPRSSGDRATASGAVCAGSNPAGGTRLVTEQNCFETWADADKRGRESVSLTPALSHCLSVFTHHLR